MNSLHWAKGWTGLVVGGWASIAVGCATAVSHAPPPSAQLTEAEAAVQKARAAAAGEDGAVGQHLRMADRELTEAKDRVSRGENRSAALLLARAEADADLSQLLHQRERALADAEVMEKQLAETRSQIAPAPPRVEAGAPPAAAPIEPAPPASAPSPTPLTPAQ